jgi:hypothetical protein
MAAGKTRFLVLLLFCLCLPQVNVPLCHAAWYPSLLQLVKTDAADLDSPFRPVLEGFVTGVEPRAHGAKVATVRVFSRLTPAPLPEEIAVVFFPGMDAAADLEEGEDVLLAVDAAPASWVAAVSVGPESLYAVAEGQFGKVALDPSGDNRVADSIRCLISALGNETSDARLAALKSCCMGMLAYRDDFLTSCAVEDLVSHPELAPFFHPDDSTIIRQYIVEAGRRSVGVELLRLFVPLDFRSEQDLQFLEDLAASPPAAGPSSSRLSEAASRVLARLSQ